VDRPSPKSNFRISVYEGSLAVSSQGRLSISKSSLVAAGVDEGWIFEPADPEGAEACRHVPHCGEIEIGNGPVTDFTYSSSAAI
jgi:hypothetical protein